MKLILHGICGDRGRPFALGSEAPHPSTITVESGMVKLSISSPWQIVDSQGNHCFGNPAPIDAGSHVFTNEQNPLAILLSQFLEDELLKVEFVHGLSEENVSSFSDDAQNFER